MPGSIAYYITLRQVSVTPPAPVVIRDQASLDVLIRIQQEAERVRQGIELITDQELQVDTP